MNIAIVDDNLEDLSSAEFYLQNFIHQNYPEHAANISIKTFSRAIDLLKNFSAGQYEIILLDIRMKNITGMQAANVIRNRGDDNAKIVFLTSSGDYTLDGYRVFAAGYILKPLIENLEDFNKTFSHIFSKIFVEEKEIILPVDRINISVPFKKIFYADIDENHRLCVHLQERKIVTTMTYLECFAILSEDTRFLECYHRIIVNMDFIKFMDKDDFILKDGSIIPISQRKKREVKSKYMSYLTRR